MKKIALMFLIGMSLANTTVYSKTINEADTELCETIKMALISSNRKPVDKVITEIIYEITLKMSPYYGPHNSYREDEVVINSSGELISYKHLKTY